MIANDERSNFNVVSHIIKYIQNRQKVYILFLPLEFMNRNFEEARNYLEPYLDFFMDSIHSEEFKRNERKFALIGGEPPEISVGFYDSWKEAVGAGYQEFGLRNFLVRQVTPKDLLFGSRRIVGFGERGRSLIKMTEISQLSGLFG